MIEHALPLALALGLFLIAALVGVWVVAAMISFAFGLAAFDTRAQALSFAWKMATGIAIGTVVFALIATGLITLGNQLFGRL